VAPPGKSKTAKKTSDPLAQYEAKRDFSRTSEPKGKRGDGTAWGFVVQRHDARRIHYDLRLELGGTLKSWAVTRGPNLSPAEKRLAVRTEDHPLQYLDFEGNIPKGEYGGGSMIVWDRGRWEPAFDPEFGLTKGHLEFTLHGERLHGRWHLVRMKPRRGETRENWLLIKAEDEFARTVGAEITEQETGSVLSGLTTQELAAQDTLRKDHAGRAKVIGARSVPLPDPGKLKGARKGILPAFLEPSLPQVTAKAPSGPKWVHEIKHDGYRVQARIDGAKVQLLTRKGLDWTARFASVPTALKSLGLSSALLDGEIVVEDTTGHASFPALQADLSAGRADRLRYFLFDILYCEGFDLTACPLGERKALLARVLERGAHEALRYSEHLDADGPTVFEHACRLGLEGIVSKRVDLPYRAGRGDHWLKQKGVLRQEFILLGYVPSTAAKAAVGALLLGYNDDDRKLRYAGRVGTGFSADQATALRTALEEIAAPKPKLANALPDGAEKGVRWTRPELVAEIEFRGWSADRLVRQSSFKGLREDRSADEVTLEIPPETAKPAHPDSTAVRLTHPERILWDEPGITKQGLAEFYTDIADWILPHIKGRVLSLKRCPSGVAAKCFFAKHAWHGLGPSLRRHDVGEKESMMTLDSLEGLLELVQASVLEIHPWGSDVARLEQPDRLIFDLDPGDGVTWTAMIEAAHEVRAQLDYDGLASFVKTSGGKGLHVVVPLAPRASWDEAKAYTQAVAERMAKAQPQRYLATMSKSARRGRIFVDYLRNGRGHTAIAPYSTRALPLASVSTPLAWEELSEAIRADHFRIDNLRQRLDVLKDDPWPEFFTLRQHLPGAKKRR
jgi:bifunctional non-homologous end joining protein LigD